MEKNVAGQKWIVFAFDRNTNVPKTGDAANITANLRIDGGAANAVDDTNPTELEGGFYAFDLTQAETNGNLIMIRPSSSTEDIQVIGIPAALWTRPPGFNASVAQTGDAFARIGEPAGDSVSADIAAVKGETASILEDTNELQTNQGNWATATGFSTHSAADVWAVATRALTDKVGYSLAADQSGVTIGTVNALTGHTPQTGDAYAIVNHGTYGNAAIRSRGDAAWITATGFSTHSAADVWSHEARTLTSAGSGGATAQEVWEYANRSLTDKAGFSIAGTKTTLDELSDLSLGQVESSVVLAKESTVQAVGDVVFAIPTNPLLTDDARLGNLDAAVSSRLATAGYTAPDNAGITAIKAKTDDLPPGIKKNAALNNFQFLMVDEADNKTGKTGLTITATRAIDGGAFASCANAAAEVGYGVYRINLAAADLNGDIITFKFSAEGANDRMVTVKTSQ